MTYQYVVSYQCADWINSGSVFTNDVISTNAVTVEVVVGEDDDDDDVLMMMLMMLVLLV